MGEDNRMAFREVHLFLHNVACLPYVSYASNSTASTENWPGFLQENAGSCSLLSAPVIYVIMQWEQSFCYCWLSNRTGILEDNSWTK